jgi:hypothetical protein
VARAFAGGPGRFGFADSFEVIEAADGNVTVGHLRADLKALEGK